MRFDSVFGPITLASRARKGTLMAGGSLSRRRVLKTLGVASVAAGFPYIKTSRSAGRLALGLWDHWVPGANDVLRQICEQWGANNGVEVTVDFITTIGNKLLLTAQAESRAKIGHDVYTMGTWLPSMFRHRLAPVDDVVGDIIAEHGPLADYAIYLAHLDGVWRAAPAPVGSPNFASVSRLDLYQKHAGVDLQKIFPADKNRDSMLVDSWDYELFLTAAEKLHAAGNPFGAPISGAVNDSNQWLGAVFAAYGASIINEAGEISVDSDEVRAVLDYLVRLTQFMPDSIYAWDDAGNNRWLISGRGSAVCNPPSAWAVANRDKPEVAKELWHHDNPRGPKGRFRTGNPTFWGIWEFSENIPAAKDLLRYVAKRDVVGRLVSASQGYDIPVITSHYRSNDYWTKAEPPRGVLYNYPVRGDEKQIVAGYPAPPEFASQIYAQLLLPNLVARVTQGGDSIEDAIAWAANEAELVSRG